MTRFHPVTIADIRRETAGSVSLGFVLPDALKEQFAFVPGQYLTLRATIDGEDLRRSYSICSALDEAQLRVGIKKVAGGAFSTYANEQLKIGDTLALMPPQGRFTLDLGKRGQHLLAIAAGSGITPILSIAKSLLSRDPAARFTLIYGNQTAQSVMFAEEWEDLKNRSIGRLSIVHVMSREAQDVALLSGRITGERLKALARGVVDVSDIDEAYLCGPQAMIADVRSALEEMGLAGERIHSELFKSAAPRAGFRAPAPQPEAGVLSRINVTLDGASRAFDMGEDDSNIVDAGARAGLDLPYSCKGGMCCTCRCKVTEGSVTMALNYSLEDWELNAGFVLACQARPKTPSVTLDFDQL
ncbi:1,2-phenylacetyl-CoA epoxidase subunit PaaE [Candidatus Raskinella chloraquaticus]|uniref:1,2-phenylacetyl-CoA epoxidase subunit PaaE n=1 Tax=Candidatus Raskinella chloraquaticus TaxID=1951219 RepID=UPI00366E9538